MKKKISEDNVNQTLMRQVIHELKNQGMSMGMTAFALAEAETNKQYMEVMKYLISIRHKTVTSIEAAETIINIIENNKN